MTFSSLPNEILVKNILPNLSIPDYCTIARIDRALNVKLESLWKDSLIDTLDNRYFVSNLYSKIAFKASNMEQTIVTLLMNMLKQTIPTDEMPSEQRFLTFVKSILPLLLKKNIEIHSETYNLLELKELTKLYNSDLGLILLKKAPLVMIKGQEIIGKEIESALMKFFGHDGAELNQIAEDNAPNEEIDSISNEEIDSISSEEIDTSSSEEASTEEVVGTGHEHQDSNRCTIS